MPDPISRPATLSPARLLAPLRELGSLGPLALFTVGGPAVGAAVLVATSEIWFEPLRGAGPLASWFLLLAGTVVLAGLSLIPTHASSLVAGMLFGAVGGSLTALAGILGAACVGYWASGRLAGDAARSFLEGRPRAAAVQRALLGREDRQVAGLIALVRLSPVMPFAATNLILAASGVRPLAFLGGTIAGIAPRVIAVAVAGAGLQQLDLGQGTDRRWAILGGLATLLALIVIGRIAKQALRRATEAGNNGEDQ